MGNRSCRTEAGNTAIMAGSSSGGGVGFQHGVIYRIKNPKDNCSLEIADASIEPKAKVIATKMWKDVPSHKFKAEEVEDAPGEFRISAVLQPPEGDKLVWDFVMGEGLVIHNTMSTSEKPTQIWLTESVEKRTDIYFIKTKAGQYLQNMGKNKQLALVDEKKPTDHRQHWKLEQKTSY